MLEGQDVVRILFHQIDDGDRRKMDAESNDAASGGGARDFRFRPDLRFLPFFGRMLPNRRNEARTLEGLPGVVEVYYGPFVIPQAEIQPTGPAHEMVVWPETPSRPRECRIARVHTYGFSALVEDDPNGGKSIFMLFQTTDGTVRAWFTTETGLQAPGWDDTVRNFAMTWLATETKSGFLDLDPAYHEQYPDG